MALSEEDQKKVQELIEAALTGEGFAKSIASAVDTTVGKALKGLKIDEKISAAVEAAKPAQPEGGGAEEPPQITKLQNQLKAMADKQAETERRAQELEEARKTEALRTAVRDALGGAGADPKRVAIALSHLQASDLIKTDDQGRPAFAFRRDWGEELLPVEKGAAEWLQTEEGKFFLPATGRSGTGDDAGQPGGGGSTTSIEAILGNALFGR